MSFARQTTEVTATGTTETGSGILYGGALMGGSAASSATIYDNTSAAGTIVRTVKAGIDTYVPLNLPPGGLHFTIGIHVVLAGAGAALYLDF